MKSLFRPAGLLLASALVLAGCASLPPQQTFNRDAHDIKTIQVLPMTESEIGLAYLNHPGASFGLIGGLVAASDVASKRKRLVAITDGAKLDHMAVFRAEFEKAMGERGYTVQWPEPLFQQGKVARDAWGLRKAYAPVEGVDAQLDMGLMFAGYATSGAGDNSPYRPAVHVVARLMDAPGKTNLFTDVITYNNITNITTAITINPDPAYAYPDFKQLEAAGPEVAEGLELALQATAARVAEQM